MRHANNGIRDPYFERTGVCMGSAINRSPLNRL